MKLFAIALQASVVTGSIEASWIDRKAEGWAWYEDRVQPEKVLKKEKEPKTPQEQISEGKKQLEEKLAEAMIHPTEQNVMNYMIEQKKWLHQSSVFAHIWGKVLLQNPELDPTATSYPVTQYGIQLQKEIENENNKRLIKNLSKENGLFFFYEGNSKISQGLSKIVKNFSEKYGWAVVAISVDGTILDEFGKPQIDNGISKTMEIAIFPALFVVNPKKKTATPIATGFVSLDQIEENIVLQFKTPKNEAPNG